MGERDSASALSRKLEALTAGSVFADRYVVEHEYSIGSNAAVLCAKQTLDNFPVLIKFCATRAMCRRDIEMYSGLSGQFVARLEGVVHSEDSGFPDALVLQSGAYTLEDWLKVQKPTKGAVQLAVHQILEGLHELHRNGIVHRDLQPNNIMFFPEENRWKLGVLRHWARDGECGLVEYNLKYVSPEMLAAHACGKAQVPLGTTADMWCFGTIAYELATGVGVFGRGTKPSKMCRMILGLSKMPDLRAVDDVSLRRLIFKTVRQNPKARWTASQALSEEKDHVHYNRGMMEFLDDQMRKTADMFKISEGPAPLRRALMKGRRLVQKHELPFDIRTFYPTNQARDAVEQICEILRDAALDQDHPLERRYSQSSSTYCIETGVPQDTVDKDREHLCNMLSFILKGEECKSADSAELLNWKDAKHRHKEVIKHLQVSDNLIRPGKKRGQGGEGHVYEAEYQHGPVAVKKPTVSVDKLPIEDMAEFMKEAYWLASLNDLHIVKLYAITVSGWIIMELADKDLHQSARMRS
ncbi:unnamed protein product [Ostreobium quekettii]|uniref:Protein kinase domain-containing protein n=1 Tax=Ostreobium quekettii TaxID=121088 RepID=A0A8S1IR67_9CHLO|nr:unnamed protein product [Ostreobium quekettii]